MARGRERKGTSIIIGMRTREETATPRSKMTNGIIIGILIGDDQETPDRVIMGVLNTLQIHAALMELTSKPSRKPRHINPWKRGLSAPPEQSRLQSLCPD